MRHLIFVLFIILLTGLAKASDHDKAVREASKAAIKQFELDRKAKMLERRYIHKDVRFYGGYVIQLADIMAQKRISHTWTFE